MTKISSGDANRIIAIQEEREREEREFEENQRIARQKQLNGPPSYAQMERLIQTIDNLTKTIEKFQGNQNQ
jgi:hypothetical protein